MLNWVQLADASDPPCKSTTEYSTPFHGRKNGLSIAKRLFNLARRIKNSKKASFFYTKNTDKSKSNKNKQKLEKLPKCLTYQTKKRKPDYNKNHAQEKFLKLINGTDKNKQYKKNTWIGITCYAGFLCTSSFSKSNKVQK